MKKVDVIKLKDTAELQLRVDEIKKDERKQAERLNIEYAKREQKDQHITEKTKKKKYLLMAIVAQWEEDRKKRAFFGAWKERVQTKQKELIQGDYCHNFYLQGLKQRGLKGFKLYAQVAGNRMYERRVKERINIEIRTKVEERKNEKEFLVAMIRELEE